MNDRREEGRRRREELVRRNDPGFMIFFRRYRVLLIVLLVAIILFGGAAYALTKSLRPEPDSEPDFDVAMESEETVVEAEGIQIETEQDVENVTAAEAPVDELEELDSDVTRDENYTHYLLLGLDGLASGFKGKRSDAIMILSVNKQEGRLIITSIPRDTYVYIEGKGYDKITHAYAYGQAKLTVETIEKNFDIDIEHYFTINFDGMEDLVDQVGGIPMYLTQAESNNIRDFFGVPGTKAGDNILSGQQAVTYCRVRIIDNDFKRTERQYKVLLALYEKAREMSVSQYPGLLQTFYNYLYTDASAVDCVDIVTSIMDMGVDSLENILLFDDDNGKGKKINGTYYLVPSDLEQTITEWRQDLGIEDYVPSDSLVTYSEALKQR